MFIVAKEIRVYGDHIFSCLLLFAAYCLGSLDSNILPSITR